MKVLLVAPSKLDSGLSNWGAPSLGLHRLAHWLERSADTEVVVWEPDLRGNPNAEDLANYDFIGFSPLNETLAEDIKLILLAQESNPGAVLIVGGVEATLNYQTIFEKTKVEWIVTGYGEQALVDIITGQPQPIAGTIRRTFSRPLSNESLWAYFHALDFSRMGYEKYWQKTESLYDEPNLDDIRTVRLITSTHCNRGCSFCSVTQWQRCAVGKIVPPTMLNAKQLIAVVSRVIEEVPDTRTIFFCEDDFCQSRQRVNEFCSWSAGTELSYLVQTSLSHTDSDLIRVLKHGRVRHLTLGIENASPRVLESFRKQQDLSRVPGVILECLDAGIVPYLLIILFAPATTVYDLVMNYIALKEWQKLGARISIEPFTMPYRGAPFWESLHDFEYGITKISDKLQIKQALRILPDDPEAREIMQEFRDEWPDYLKSRSISHHFKGATSSLMIDLLGSILLAHGRWEIDVE